MECCCAFESLQKTLTLSFDWSPALPFTSPGHDFFNKFYKTYGLSQPEFIQEAVKQIKFQMYLLVFHFKQFLP